MEELRGLLMYVPGDPLRVLLGHPGAVLAGQRRRRLVKYTKGLPAPGEDLLTAAQREFFEETGLEPSPPFLPLHRIKQKSGKRVQCWAFAGSEAPIGVGASTFEIEWPSKSGKRALFPEIDDARLFAIDDAHAEDSSRTGALLDELEALLAAR